MNIGGSRRLLGVGSVILAAAAGVVGVVIFANPAGAWHVEGFDVAAQTCEPATGTFTVTYAGSLSNPGKISVTDFSPSESTVSAPEPEQVDSHGSFKITQTGVPANAGTASVDIKITWIGTTEGPAKATATATFKGTCAQNATATTPAFTNGTCSSPTPTYTIPDSKGVDYQVNGTTVSPGSHDATPDSSVQVDAVAQQGFKLTGDTTWKWDFSATPTVCTGTSPSFTAATCAAPQASYTIPVTDGIEYWVDGKEVAAGTHSAADGSTVKITAIASDGHALTGTTTWTHTFSDVPLHCVVTSHPTAPSFANATCSTSGSYTIPSTPGVEYKANGVTVTAGKHTASAGTTVTITASAKPGHALTGTTTWKHTFPAMPPCALGTGSLANTGPDFPVGQTTLVAGLLAMFGALCLLAGRRPSAPGRHSAITSIKA